MIKVICSCLLLFLILSVLSSCAWLFNGVKQPISIKSMTPDSKIYVDGNYEGSDCVSVKLKRNNNHSIIVKKDGYQTEAINLGTHTQIGWMIYDVLSGLCGNCISLPLDALTGSWKALDKTNIVVDLQPKS